MLGECVFWSNNSTGFIKHVEEKLPDHQIHHEGNNVFQACFNENHQHTEFLEYSEVEIGLQHHDHNDDCSQVDLNGPNP